MAPTISTSERFCSKNIQIMLFSLRNGAKKLVCISNRHFWNLQTRLFQIDLFTFAQKGTCSPRRCWREAEMHRWSDTPTCSTTRDCQTQFCYRIHNNSSNMFFSVLWHSVNFRELITIFHRLLLLINSKISRKLLFEVGVGSCVSSSQMRFVLIKRGQILNTESLMWLMEKS